MGENEHPEKWYRQATSRSRELHQQARDHMPGGNTRHTVHLDPYPIYINSGDGCKVTDVDGNEYLDLFNNATTLIHGHADPDIVDAARKATEQSSVPGGPTTSEIEWAKHLCDRAPAVESVRFTNSGTEATMNAIRAARAYTGRDVIAKFEGVYHGTHDDAQISIHPPRHLAGTSKKPNSIPDSAGIPASKRDDVLVLPYNDSETTGALLDEHRSDLAGVIIAPHMGSQVVPSSDQFVEFLAEYTTQHDIPLIFDEVMSFRGAYGGAHSDYGITPDLVTFGKIIGGGFPAGAFGGRRELLEQFAPGTGIISHGGTFNANPVAASAGLAALEKYTSNEVKRLNSLTEKLADSAQEAFGDHGIAAQVTSYGSIFSLNLTDADVVNYRTKQSSVPEIDRRLYLELLREGVRLGIKGYGVLSTPMTDEHIDRFLAELDNALSRLKPVIHRRAPHLIM